MRHNKLFTVLSHLGAHRLTFICSIAQYPWADPEGVGGQGLRTPLKNHKKNVCFFSNAGPDPLKNTKLPSQNSMLDHHRHASETPLK